MSGPGIKRERDEDEETQELRRPANTARRSDRGNNDGRRLRISFPVTKWKDLSAKGYLDILKRLEGLLWAPMLYDDALRDLNTYTEVYRRGDGKDIAAHHRKMVRDLNTQSRLTSLPETQEQLGVAMQSMRRLRILTICPTRHLIHRPKPERLTVYAFTSIIAALGHKRGEAQAQAQAQAQGKSTKGVAVSSCITTLNIVDVDLCALLACVPCRLPAVHLAEDQFGYAYHLPAGLVGWHDMYLAWCTVACTVTQLHLEFIRSEAFNKRLEQVCWRNNVPLNAQQWRTTSVLAACQQLQLLFLNFSFRPVQALPNPLEDSDSASSSNSESRAPEVRPVPPELDISYILPYCALSIGSGEDVRNFRLLRRFGLSTIILRDSSAFLNFLKNHMDLEELQLTDVGYRYGPDWSEILNVVVSSLRQLRELRLVRLTYVDQATNTLQEEDKILYKTVEKVLTERVNFSFE